MLNQWSIDFFFHGWLIRCIGGMVFCMLHTVKWVCAMGFCVRIFDIESSVSFFLRGGSISITMLSRCFRLEISLLLS